MQVAQFRTSDHEPHPSRSLGATAFAMVLVLAVGSGGADRARAAARGMGESVALTGPVVNVRDCGAKGDGQRDDTPAFQEAARRIREAGGGRLVIPKGVYRVGQQVHEEGKYPYYRMQDIIFLEGIDGLVIEGEPGSILRLNDGLRFGSFDKDTGEPFDPVKEGRFKNGVFADRRYCANAGIMIRIRDSRNVLVRNLELDGNSDRLVQGGIYGDKGRQCWAYGLHLLGNRNVRVENVHTHHHGCDGILVGYPGLKEHDPPTAHVLVNVTSEYNGRQALSWVGGRGLTAIGCKFNHTGRGAVASAPGAGLDIEAERSICREGLFVDCEFVNNRGCGVVADSGDGGYTRFVNCTIWGTTSWSVWAAKPGLAFEDCSIFGSIVHGYGSKERPERATRYLRCRFEDREYPGAGVYRATALVIHSGDNVTFEDCTIEAEKTKACYIDYPDREVFRNCTIVHAAERPDHDFQSIFRGSLLENVHFKERYPDGTEKKYYIAAQGVRVRGDVTVDGPVCKWGNWSWGTTGRIRPTLTVNRRKKRLKTPAREFTLVRDGQPAATIALPAATEFHTFLERRMAREEEEYRKASPEVDAEALETFRSSLRKAIEKDMKRVGDEEEMAAEELRAIIERISGAELAVQRPAAGKLPDGPAILLGAELARLAGFGNELDALAQDGLLCAVKGRFLVLAGRRARGTLYSVYEFLESLGCRWVMPGAFGEIYPSMKTITTRIARTDNPAHVQRYFWCTYGNTDEYPRWTLRNKGNFVRALGDPRVNQSHALAQALAWGSKQEAYRVRGVRTLRERVKQADGTTRLQTVDKEVWTLPDRFYALRNGTVNTRTPNMANPDVWKLYAEYNDHFFRTRPLDRYVSMSAEDGLVEDERPASRALMSYEFDNFMGAYSATDKIWFFLNRVLERMEFTSRGRKVGVLVYSNNLMPPGIEQLHPNMALVFAPLGVSPLHHVRDPRSKTNRKYREWLEDWMRMAQAAGAETYYYDYEPTGYCWNMAMICPRWGIIGRNYPWFHELGLDGYTTQGHDDWAACGLDNYLMQRLYWNINQDYREVVADYAKARFGAAAPVMIKYYNLLEERMNDIPDLYANEVWDNHLILTPEVRRSCRGLLRNARARADTDRARKHLETMVELQRSTDAMCDAEETARGGDFASAAQRMETVFQVRDRLNRIYPSFMHRKRLDDTVKAQYMTGGIYNLFKAWDARIRSAAAHVVLPREWEFFLDTRNQAYSLGLHKPGSRAGRLAKQDVTVCPDIAYGTQRDPAAFFYRTSVDVPETFGGNRVTLFFPALIARALNIWVNGEAVRFEQDGRRDTVWRGPKTFWTDYNHTLEFDITDLVKPGEANLIAFRVFKSFDFGGTYRRIFLLADHPR